MAHGGTVFLDEIGEVPLPIQVKLLRFLQERTFRRIGSTEDISVNVKIICATNKDLENEVASCAFREDLYYRLNVIQIHIPPLRERKEDIPLLAHYFLNKYSRELNRKVTRISEEAMKLLTGYSFPGNIRELENIIERAVVLETSTAIMPESLPAELLTNPNRDHTTKNNFLNHVLLPDEGIRLEKFVEDIEKQLIHEALKRTHGVKKKAAHLLNVSFRSFRYRLEKYAIDGHEQGE
jgi:two-component system response regulator PilR (NtrC family)